MAVLPNHTVKVLVDVSYVSPPPGSVPTASFPLTFFDIKFLHATMQPLCFFDFPFPIIPSVSCKTSFPNSKHLCRSLCNICFLMQAILCSLHHIKLLISYIKRVILFRFSLLNPQPISPLDKRSCSIHFQEFQALVPRLPPASMAQSNGKCSGFMQKPVMAIQVTVFPMVGISIGLAFYHAAADGRTLAHFMGSWSSLMSQGNLTCLKNSLLSK